MKWGNQTLYCQMCGNKFLYTNTPGGGFMYHNSFGIVCSKACHDIANVRYARLILGKDELEG